MSALPKEDGEMAAFSRFKTGMLVTELAPLDIVYGPDIIGGRMVIPVPAGSVLASGRSKELVVVRHDKDFTPRVPFTVQIDWIACSAQVVDDYLQKLTRRARQNGFNLVQMPILEWLREHPYRVTRRIDFTASPQRSRILQILEDMLVTSFDFLEVRRSKKTMPYQLMHVSGVTMVALGTEGSVTWIINHLPVMRVHIKSSVDMFLRFSQQAEAVIAAVTAVGTILNAALDKVGSSAASVEEKTSTEKPSAEPQVPASLLAPPPPRA